MKFNDSTKKIFTLSFDSWATDRKTVDTQLEKQVDKGSAQTTISPKILIVAHQTAARKGVPSKANNIAFYDTLNTGKISLTSTEWGIQEMVLLLVTRQMTISINIEILSYFIKSMLGKNHLVLFIEYTDMKNIYPIQVVDLRFQFENVNPKELQLFEEYRGATNIARMFLRLNTHRKVKLISEGNKTTEVTNI